MNTPPLLLAFMHARLWVPAEPLSSPRFFISGLSESRRLLFDLFFFLVTSRVRVQCCRVPCCRWVDRTFQIIFQPNNNSVARMSARSHALSRVASRIFFSHAAHATRTHACGSGGDSGLVLVKASFALPQQTLVGPDDLTFCVK